MTYIGMDIHHKTSTMAWRHPATGELYSGKFLIKPDDILAALEQLPRPWTIAVEATREAPNTEAPGAHSAGVGRRRSIRPTAFAFCPMPSPSPSAVPLPPGEGARRAGEGPLPSPLPFAVMEGPPRSVRVLQLARSLLPLPSVRVPHLTDKRSILSSYDAVLSARLR